MRIASISKSLTMAVLAKLVEEGKVNLGKDKTGFLSSRQKAVFFPMLNFYTMGIRTHYCL